MNGIGVGRAASVGEAAIDSGDTARKDAGYCSIGHIAGTKAKCLACIRRLERCVRQGFRPVQVGQSVLFCIFNRGGDVAATIGKITAREGLDDIAVAIAPARHAILAFDLKTLEFVLQYDIDRACNRVCAIDRRSADGQHLDMIDEPDRNGIEIDFLAGRRSTKGARRRRGATRNEPSAIDQNQRTLCA